MTAAIDPRLRARRIAVRRDEGRRRLSRLVRLLVAVALLGGAALATRTPLLDVDRLEVVGAEHTSLADIEAASGIATGDPMTDVDPATARRGIERLPWVASASVTHAWPGDVRVSVTERAPVSAVAAGQDRWLLVDAEGRLLEATAAVPPGLVAIADVAVPTEAGGTLPEQGRDALAIAARLPSRLAGQVLAVAPVAGGLELRLAGGGKVVFGPLDDADDKLVAVATMLTQVDGHCLAVLDVRVASAPVLTRVPGCA